MEKRISIDNTPPKSSWVGPVSFVLGMVFVMLLDMFFMGVAG